MKILKNRTRPVLFLAALILLVTASACDTDSDDDELFCDAEMGFFINKSAGEAAAKKLNSQMSWGLDYADILSLKYEFTPKTDLSTIKREYRVPESEVREAMSTLTSAEVEMYIDTLKAGGNVIFVFYATENKEQIGWLYLSKSA